MTIICCEIGSNHLGDFNRTKEMIQAIAENGGHFAKLQMFQPAQYPHNILTPEAWLPELESYANSLGLGFLCSWFYVPHDIPPIVKLAYSQRHNFKLRKAFLDAKCKIIMSGDENTLWVKDSIQLKCVPKYPAVKKEYGRCTLWDGISDHTVGIDFALKLNPKILEKHFKLGDEIEKKSPDSGDFAITPWQLQELACALFA